MERLWNNILERFGQQVTLKDGHTEVVRAIVQPWLDRSGDQQIPSPLGLERQERFRYLGPADRPLGPDTRVEWGGRPFTVRAAHLAGAPVCPHWWAVLEPGEEAEA